MNQAEGLINCYKEQGFPCDIKPAPKDAVTFDQMIIVWSNPEKSMIKRIHFYNSKTGILVGAK